MLSSKFVSTALRLHAPFLLLLLLALPVFLIRLPQVPTPWFDEGINLTAAKTLAETGVYGLPSADGLRPADPAIQTGPPLIILLAALHPLIGANIGLVRLLMVILSLVTLVVFYALGNRLYGTRAAFLAILILLILPGSTTGSFIMQSRQFLGEIPAVLCISLAMLLLLTDKLQLRHNILIGLCLGIASALKSQVLVMVLATLALRALYALRDEPGIWKRWGVILIVMFLVYALDTGWRMIMAGDSYGANMAVLREGIAIHIFPFQLLDNLRSGTVLFRLALVGGAVGGVIAMYRANPALIQMSVGKRRVERFLLVLITIWICWYAIASIGWIRYAFIALVFCTLFFGRVGAWLWERFSRLQDWRGYALLIGAGVSLILVEQVPLLKDTQGDDFYTMMQHVETTIPDDATIVTWEWSATYLTDHQYLLPETAVTNSITASVFFSERYEYDATIFDARPGCPDYMLYGSFSVDEMVLGYSFLDIELTPVFSVGDYELYAIPQDALPEDAHCDEATIG